MACSLPSLPRPALCTVGAGARPGHPISCHWTDLGCEVPSARPHSGNPRTGSMFEARVESRHAASYVSIVSPNRMEKSMEAIALGAFGAVLLASAASAAPLNATTIGSAEVPNVEQVVL